jgi:MSHA biogenesis protein MshO
MAHRPNTGPLTARGVTLIELIIVIVLIGVLSIAVSRFLIQPFLAYEDLTRRALLTDIADTAVSRLARELRLALPNSVRIATSGNLTSIEFLRTREGARYRAQPDALGAGDVLDFTVADTSFDLIGTLVSAPGVGDLAVVYNLTATGTVANAYIGDNRADVGAGSTSGSVVLNPAFQFPFASPSQRVYLVEEAVSYVCDGAAGTLNRYAGYAIAAMQPVPPGGGSALVVDRLSACTFDYDAGAGTRNGLVILRLAVTEEGETVSLLKQVHVLNAP